MTAEDGVRLLTLLSGVVLFYSTWLQLNWQRIQAVRDEEAARNSFGAARQQHDDRGSRGRERSQIQAGAGTKRGAAFFRCEGVSIFPMGVCDQRHFCGVGSVSSWSV